jgi:hypothetical protein
MIIFPSFDFSTDKDSGYPSFLQSIEKLLEQILPPEVLELHRDSEAFFQALAPFLPLVRCTQLQEGGNSFGVSILSNAEFSHGTGRFISDALSRRLIPGKIVELGGTRTLSFYFFKNDQREHLINERWIIADNAETLELMRKNLPILAQELRLTLLSISKARHYLSTKSGPLEEKTSLMQETLHQSTFEEMHGIIKRLSAEKTFTEIRGYISPYYQKRPKVFDRDIFEEIKPFMAIYDEQFIGNRPMRSVARIICYHFYFKKLLERRSQEAPLQRHVLLKLFRKKESLGILVCLNLFGDNEVLKKQHLIEAIRNCLPDADEIPDSFFADTTSEYLPILYLEIEHNNKRAFSSDEILTLRTKLPLELKECIQSVFNPLFMLRNDEDHLRHIIALSHQLTSVKDIPQVVISFEEQTAEEVSFSVVLLRVLLPKSTPFKEILSALPFKTYLRELKNIGWIRNKYPKEAAVFKVSMSKKPFLRKNRSLDLPKARQTLLAQLTLLFEDVRDYNGGLLSKQLETLQQLKTHLGSLAKEFSFPLENFFFSLEPSTAQTTISPTLLKEGFMLLLELIKMRSVYETHCSKEGFFGGFIISTPEAKESLISFLETAKTTFSDLSYSLTYVQDLFCLTIFLSNKNNEIQKEFNDLLIAFASARVILNELNTKK